jgi:hypothetical protein
LFQGVCDVKDVRQDMLPVGIGGDDTLYLRQISEDLVETGLEGAAFAEVDRVAQYADAADGLELLEDGLRISVAAVVDDQHHTEACSDELFR